MKSGDYDPESILYKSTAGRYRSVRVADGPITARCRFIKNASWGEEEEEEEKKRKKMKDKTYEKYSSSCNSSSNS